MKVSIETCSHEIKGRSINRVLCFSSAMFSSVMLTYSRENWILPGLCGLPSEFYPVGEDRSLAM